jgi:hypothetical protein
MMRPTCVTVIGVMLLAGVMVGVSAGCKPAEPAAAPAPAPTATTEQPQGANTTTGVQAPAVPDSAEPAGSQVQFK